MTRQEFPSAILKHHMPVQNEEDVRAILATWILVIGGGFHPDTSGANYVYDQKERTFTDSQARVYDASLEQCFDCSGQRVYQIGLQIYKVILGRK